MVSESKAFLPRGQNLRVVDPTTSSVAKSVDLAQRPDRLEGLRLALLDNGKPYAEHFLDSVWKQLTDLYGVDKLYYQKSAPSVTFSQDEYGNIVDLCQVAITAIGD